MRVLLTCAAACLCARVATAAPPAASGPSAPAKTAEAAGGAKLSPEALSAALEDAVAAWSEGKFAVAHERLTQIQPALEASEDPLERERGLRFLADSLLLDSAMPADQRDERARAVIGLLLDADPEWAPPPGQHSPELYALADAVVKARGAEKAAACEANLVACRADYGNERILHDRAKEQNEELQAQLAGQKEHVYETVVLNRAVALIPFGVGHFYNGRPGLGAGFLTAEVTFGGAGLGLLLWRTFAIGCRRTAGFAPGSLQCEGKENEIRGTRVRRAEEVMGWLTLSAFVGDVVVSQILFRDRRTIDRGLRDAKPREGDESLEELDEARRKEQAAREADGDARLQWRPGTVLTPKGAGMGLRMRF